MVRHVPRHQDLQRKQRHFQLRGDANQSCNNHRSCTFVDTFAVRRHETNCQVTLNPKVQGSTPCASTIM